MAPTTQTELAPQSGAQPEPKPVKKKRESNRMLGRTFLYYLVYGPIWLAFMIYHPFRFYGRKNIPQGPAVWCCNHSGFADPIWVFLATRQRVLPWTMAKKSVMDTPVLGKFLALFGAFGVDRDNPDVAAVKKSLRVLKNGENLLIFPEGTRVKHGKQVAAKSGAVMLAHRAGVPLVPIYLTHNRRPFMPVKCVIGEPYTPEYSGKRVGAEELEQHTEELMRRIYALGESQKRLGSH